MGVDTICLYLNFYILYSSGRNYQLEHIILYKYCKIMFITVFPKEKKQCGIIMNVFHKQILWMLYLKNFE